MQDEKQQSNIMESLSIMDNRKAFEKWFEADAMPAEADWFVRDALDNDEYDHVQVQFAWEGWQAAIAQDRIESQKREAELQSDRARVAENLIQSLKREAELQERVKALKVLVRGYSNELDTAMGTQHDLETEIAKYKEAKPSVCIHPDTLSMLNESHNYRDGGVCWTPRRMKNIDGLIALYAHPDNAKE